MPKKKTVYSRKDREEELEDKLFTQKKKQQAKLDAVPEKNRNYGHCFSF